MEAFLRHRLAQEERRQLDLGPTDAIGLSEAKGRRKILEELLSPGFKKEMQDWLVKECQKEQQKS